MTLRRQIIAGFAVVALPVVLLALVAYAVIGSLGGAVETVLQENERSLEAAAEMEGALERMDSAALTLLLGQRDEADAISLAARPRFLDALAVADGNLTIEGEGDVVEGARTAFTGVERAFVAMLQADDQETARATYGTAFTQAFTTARARVDELERLNRDTAQASARDARMTARMARWTVLIGALLALVLVAWAAIKLSREIAAHPGEA
jgi:CHASE3 domain sensor protein